MKRYKVTRPPIFLDTFGIIKVGEVSPQVTGGDYVFRICEIEEVGEVKIAEYPNKPLAVGMEINYDIGLDDFAVFDLTKAHPSLVIEEVEKDDMQQTFPQATHIRI